LIEVEWPKPRIIEVEQRFHPIIHIDRVSFGRKDEDEEGIEPIVNILCDYDRMSDKQRGFEVTYEAASSGENGWGKVLSEAQLRD
jgi:hypothetical protein